MRKQVSETATRGAIFTHTRHTGYSTNAHTNTHAHKTDSEVSYRLDLIFDDTAHNSTSSICAFVN